MASTMTEQRFPNGQVIFGLPEQVIPTKLVRHRDMVHRRWCWRVSHIFVNPWQWAEGKPRAEVASASENGLKFCRSCKPLDHI